MKRLFAVGCSVSKMSFVLPFLLSLDSKPLMSRECTASSALRPLYISRLGGRLKTVGAVFSNLVFGCLGSHYSFNQQYPSGTPSAITDLFYTCSSLLSQLLAYWFEATGNLLDTAVVTILCRQVCQWECCTSHFRKMLLLPGQHHINPCIAAQCGLNVV